MYLGDEEEVFSYLVELYKNPKYKGKLKNYNAKAKIENKSCGDTLTFYLKIEKGKIKDISFEGKGCVISIASASLLAEYVKGKKVEEVEKLSPKKLFSLIGIDLSKNPIRAKCALLSLITLDKAIKEFKD